MFTKALLALAAASLVGQAVAGPAHHGHQHLHGKRDLVTEVKTVTHWVTVYATGTKVYYAPTRKTSSTSSTSTSTSSSSSSSAAAPPPPPPPPPPPAAVPTTFATLPKPDPTPEPAPAPPASQPAPPPPPPPPPSPPPVVEAPAEPTNKPAPAPTPKPSPQENGGQSGKPQRGLAFNLKEMLPGFLKSGSHITWTYNWWQVDTSDTGLEFVPMLWSDGKGFPATWNANVEKALRAGSKALLSFNEPDHHEQANMSPSHAADAHIKLMNPWASKFRIGSPAITNSGSKNMGIDWMKQFFAACAGRCEVDFVVAHAYGLNGKDFLQHLVNVHKEFGKPVWVTEFGFPGSTDEVDRTLAFVINELDNNPTYSFVEKYAYFMASQGSMVEGNGLSKFGKTFAYVS